jgi:predicted PurR-regulated permease PerM
MGIMLWILGVPSPIFWGLITAFLSSFPFLGPFLVYAPLSLYLLAIGFYWKALILFLVGVIIIGECEDVIRPLFMKNRMKVHFLLVLLGMMGGIATFGILGFFIGPLIVSLLVTFISLYKLDFE